MRIINNKPRRASVLAGGLVLAFFAVTGCAQPLPIPASQSIAVTFSAVAIPRSPTLAYVHVKLIPRVNVAAATLTAASPDKDVSITPAKITVKELRAYGIVSAEYGASPPLAKKLMQTFTVKTGGPGKYAVTVTLSYDRKSYATSLILNLR